MYNMLLNPPEFIDELQNKRGEKIPTELDSQSVKKCIVNQV